MNTPGKIAVAATFAAVSGNADAQSVVLDAAERDAAMQRATADKTNCAVIEVDSQFSEDQHRMELGRQDEGEQILVTSSVSGLYGDDLRLPDGPDMVTSCTDLRLESGHGDRVLEHSLHEYRARVQLQWLRSIWIEDGGHHIAVKTPGDEGPD